MAKKMSQPRRLTLKQRNFSDEYIKNGGNGTQAALSAYATTSPNTANQIAMANLRQPTVRAYVDRRLELEGFGPEQLALKLIDIVENGTPSAKFGAWDRIMAIYGFNWKLVGTEDDPYREW